jgi:uncharacterized protein YeaO (DUF488 family)
MIKIKRIYDLPLKDDGYRALVDRLWPRGLKKENVAIDIWLKEIAPSTALRMWFNHDPEKWQVFKSRYFEELATNDSVQDLLKACENNSVITLLFAAREQNYNHAVVLKSFLEGEIVNH